METPNHLPLMSLFVTIFMEIWLARPERILGVVYLNTGKGIQIRIDKAREDTRCSVSDHRQRDPDKAREDTRYSVSQHRQKDPLKTISDNRRWVTTYYVTKIRDATKQRVQKQK